MISDLHLCEAEKAHPKDPLWKKYKTREFFFDDVFSGFLSHLRERAQGEMVELILNGDIFDFDSVTSLPEAPTFRTSWLERHRGLHPQEDKSLFKIKKILEDHEEWTRALANFIKTGNRVIFILGNHDLELHFPSVQKHVLKALDLLPEEKKRVRFCEWFYISNGDTLIEHGNQYDPYCVCQDPINPFVVKGSHIEMRLPFGNLATRYLINGMGYFNPHVDSNFILTAREYLVFFFKYMVRSQPLLVWTWLWGSFVTLFQTFFDRLLPVLRDPMVVEERSAAIAKKSNTTPGVVRQMRSMSVSPAANNPWLLATELWLDRAMILMVIGYVIMRTYFTVDDYVPIAVWWIAIPLVLFLPPFVFYSTLVASEVVSYKKPRERILMNSSWITGTNRVVYGHTHITCHEVIGGVEHLNSGCWSPAFVDVECTRAIDRRAFVWIFPGSLGAREAELLVFEGGEVKDQKTRRA